MSDGQDTETDIGEEHAALTALSGADYVREKLLSTLTMGAFDFSRRIYAIKCRVKGKTKLVEKVRKRRESKPDYDAGKVTDIVGLRLICLFSMDLPRTVSDFLDYIEFMQDPRLGLFRGDKLDDAIGEAIVYASTSDPVIYRAIYETLAGRLQAGIESGSVKCEMVPPTEDLPYSSIHIICKTNSFYSEPPREIPIEVQIRTAFEDVWSEIDHPRRYKGPDFATMYAHDVRLSGLAQGIGDRLKDLKGHLENCSSSAERIRKDFDLLNQSAPPTALQASSETNPRILARSWADQQAPEGIKKKLRSIEESLTVTYGKLYKNDIVDPQADLVALRRELEEAIEKIKGAGAEYKQAAPELFERDKTFKYYSHMESGLALYWLGRFGQDKATAGSSTLIEDALKTYIELQNSLNETDPLLSYRIANALKAQGHHELATHKLEEAVAGLDADTRLSKDNVYRTIIPRTLGFLLWQRAQELIKMGKSLGHPGGFGAQARRMLLQAILVTAKGKATIGALKAPDAASETTKFCGNLMSFIVDFLSNGGSSEELKQNDIDPEALLDLTEVANFETKAVGNAARLDTCCRVYHLLEQKEAMVRCGDQLQEALKNSGKVSYSSESIAYMKETLALIRGKP